jgi:hypothetical protein
MEFVFSQQIFEEYINIEFHENPSIGGRELFHACEWAEGRTGRQEEANGLLPKRLEILKKKTFKELHKPFNDAQ